MADRVKSRVRVNRTILASVIERESRSFARDSAYRIASRLAGQLRAKILAQSFHHQSLNPAYLAWKTRMGLDTRILIASGAYVNSIQPRKVGDTSYNISPGSQVTESGATLHDIGFWHEFGTENMPARPHWQPIWREFSRNQSQLIAELKKELAGKIGSGLKGKK